MQRDPWIEPKQTTKWTNTHTPHVRYKRFLKLDKRSVRRKIFGDYQLQSSLWLVSLPQHLQHCLADNLQFWFLLVSCHLSLTTDLNYLGVYMNAHSDQEKKLRKLQFSLSLGIYRFSILSFYYVSGKSLNDFMCVVSFNFIYSSIIKWRTEICIWRL